MTRCENGNKLLDKFWKDESWVNHKNFDVHTVECDVCSGRND